MHLHPQVHSNLEHRQQLNEVTSEVTLNSTGESIHCCVEYEPLPHSHEVHEVFQQTSSCFENRKGSDKWQETFELVKSDWLVDWLHHASALGWQGQWKRRTLRVWRRLRVSSQIGPLSEAPKEFWHLLWNPAQIQASVLKRRNQKTKVLYSCFMLRPLQTLQRNEQWTLRLRLRNGRPKRIRRGWDASETPKGRPQQTIQISPRTSSNYLRPIPRNGPKTIPPSSRKH